MWKTQEVQDAVIEDFRKAREELGLWPVVVHTSYLINLSTPDDTLYKKSCELFTYELELCERLGVDYLVTHPGSHQGRGVTFAKKRVIKAFKNARKKTAETVQILIENTAGGGTQIGRELADIGELIKEADLNIGLCFDTCHGFAKGYAIAEDSSNKKTTSLLPEVIGKEVGLENLKLIHLNDSKGEQGSKLDRHEHIGKGRIGKKSLSAFLNHPKIKGIPIILETPENAEGTDKTNLKTVRAMLRAQPARRSK
jgi:deoxyribonuclease-4